MGYLLLLFGNGRKISFACENEMTILFRLVYRKDDFSLAFGDILTVCGFKGGGFGWVGSWLDLVSVLGWVACPGQEIET